MRKLNKKLLWTSLMIMLLVTVTTLAMVNVTSASPGTYIYVTPTEVTGLSIGDLFLIYIYVNEAPPTYAWEVHISWDSNIAELMYKKEGDFLKRGGAYLTTFATYPPTPPWDEANLLGEIMVGCSLYGYVPMDQWASGNGELFRLGFKVTGEGSFLFNLFDTVLLDHWEAGSVAPTPYPNDDSFFYNVYPSHDIKITDITTVNASVHVGEVANINVTVLNEGTEDETITLNVYAGVTIIDTAVLSLNGTGNFENRSLTYQVAWDTTDEANYTISAEVTPVSGEVDTSDNTLTDGNLYVLYLSDIRGPENPPGSGLFPPDGQVDMYDFGFFGLAYGKSSSDPDWEDYKIADIRGPENPPGSGLFPPDGQVDMYDFGYCGLEYGSSI